MKKRTLFALFFLLMASFLSAQTTCTYYDAVYTGTNGGYGDISDIICWEFARAYLKKNPDTSTHNIPSPGDLAAEAALEKNGKFCQDPDFTLTTNPNEADIVVWVNNINFNALHVSVAIGEGQFISKDDSKNSIEEHEMCILTYKPKVYFKYKSRGMGLGSEVVGCSCNDPSVLFTSCGPGGPGGSCVNGITGTINSSQPLISTNSLSPYFSIVSLNTTCSSLNWTKQYGNGSWSSGNNGKTLYLYLDSYEYLSLKATAPGQTGFKTYFFERSGSNYRLVEGKATAIYPNPFDQYVHLEMDLLGAMVRIYDLQGRVLKQIEQCPAKVNLADLSPGMYLIEAVLGDKMIYSQKIVKR